MNVSCPECGRENEAGDQFCSKCGSKLAPELDSTMSFGSAVEAGEEAYVDLDKLGVDGPVLVVVKGIGVGQAFALGEEVCIGRDPGNDIFLDDVTVSRKHARIKRQSGKLVLLDIGSLNGTYLNKERVDQAFLANKDEIQIGRFKMVFLDHRGVGNGD